MFTTWKVSRNPLNLRKQFAEGFFQDHFPKPLILKGKFFQYLCHLRKAEGGLGGMNTTQAGDLVENLA